MPSLARWGSQQTAPVSLRGVAHTQHMAATSDLEGKSLADSANAVTVKCHFQGEKRRKTSTNRTWKFLIGGWGGVGSRAEPRRGWRHRARRGALGCRGLSEQGPVQGSGGGGLQGSVDNTSVDSSGMGAVGPFQTPPGNACSLGAHEPPPQCSCASSLPPKRPCLGGGICPPHPHPPTSPTLLRPGQT